MFEDLIKKKEKTQPKYPSVQPQVYQYGNLLIPIHTNGILFWIHGIKNKKWLEEEGRPDESNKI